MKKKYDKAIEMLNGINEYKDSTILIKYSEARKTYEDKTEDAYERIKKAYLILSSIDCDEYEGELKDEIVEFKNIVTGAWEKNKFINELGKKTIETIEFYNR